MTARDFDVVTRRAFASLNEFVAATAHLLDEGRHLDGDEGESAATRTH